MTSVLVHLMITAVLGCNYLMSYNCLTLDEYCFLQLPPTKRIFKSKIGFMQTVYMYSNIEAYNECLLFARMWDVPGIEVEQYEKNFPSTKDMYKAGYVFCGEELYARMPICMQNEDEIGQCEQIVDYELCRQRVRNAFYPQRSTAVLPPCNVNVVYYRCLRDIYKACNKNFGDYFTYFMARLGEKCLIAQNEYNKMILTIICREHSPAQSVNESSVTRHRCWSVIAGLCFVLRNAIRMSA